MKGVGKNKEDRNALKDEDRLWPQGVVPYVLDGSLSSGMRKKIAEAIKDYSDNTCVKFVKRSGESDYVFIHSQKSGCFARLGRQGGQQELNLQDNGCQWKGTIIHEMLHTIGFAHEQSRNDRDQFIKVNWNYIESDAKSQFDKMDAEEEWNNKNFGYDYKSVMHYPEDGFRIKGLGSDKKVIETKDKSKQSEIGQRFGFSTQDAQEVNALYKCSNGKSGIAGKNGCNDRHDIKPKCSTLKKYCHQDNIKQACRKSCGAC